MKLRETCKYAIACPTSMGVRITPENRMAVHNSNLFYLQSTSAETNVLNVASSLGYACLALTKFVEGSPIAAFIKSQLRARNIRYEGLDVPQGGPWGYRHQFNIADSGFGLRAARVWNDRAGEVGRTLSIDDFDVERIFGQEGVGILHLSGLIAAMSEDTTKCCLALAKAAKQYGTLVSFDLNYRATFWKGREEELRSAFHEIASCADILVGNEEDFQLCLGFKGPEAGGKDLKTKIENFKGMIREVQAKYSNASVFATTLREVVSANRNLWGAIMLAEGQWYVEEPREIDILDRIGGGDGFTGGLLYGVWKGWEPQKWVQFGWATGVEKFGEDAACDALIRKYGYRGRLHTLEEFRKPENQDLRDNMGAAAHLIHGSSDGRFSVTYAARDISQEEIAGVGFIPASYDELVRKYNPETLRYGCNTVDGEEIYFIPNPALGLWINRETFTE